MSKKQKTIILIVLVIIFGAVVLYASQSGSGNLFQGALRTIETTDTRISGVSRTAETIETDVREAEETDLGGTLTATAEPDYSTTIDASEEDIEINTTLSASAEEDDIREAEETTLTIGQIEGASTTIDAGEEENDYTISATADNNDGLREAEETNVSIGQIDSSSTTIDSSESITVAPSALQQPDPECPAQSYMLYGSTSNDDYQSALNQIDSNPAGCSFRFVMNSAGVQDVVTCSSGEVSVFNDQINCDQILSQGSLHASLKVYENEARYGHRFNQGETYRNHVTNDFAIWVVGTNG